MDALLQDARYGLRILVKNPAFALTVVSILALGIGANTAIFSIADAALLQAMPFEDGESLVIVNGVADRPDGPQVRGASYLDVLDWRSAVRKMEPLVAVSGLAVNLAAATDVGAERVVGEIVGEGYFDVLRVAPQLGRTFTASESQEVDAHRVAVISDALWERRFLGDPAAVGSELQLNGQTYTVLGVMPVGFAGVTLTADLWVPMAMVSAIRSPSILQSREGRWLFAISRLLPQATLQQAQEDLDLISSRLERVYPESNAQRRALVRSMRENFVGNLQMTLVVLLVSVGAVLLIACANVTNLLLARSRSRGTEVALRRALGAGRARLARQILTESLTLAICGGLVGILVAMWTVEGLDALVPPGVLPAYVRIALNWRAYLFTGVVTLLSGFAFGLAPALRMGSSDLRGRLSRGAFTLSAGAAARRGDFGLQSLVVAGQVALTTVLLVGAGLMSRSLLHQLASEIGFKPSGVTMFRLTLPRAQYDHAGRVQLAEQVLASLEALPTVGVAAVGTDVPFRGRSSADLLWRGDEVVADGEGTRFYRHRVSPGYFDALGVPLIDGRGFETRDDTRGAPVALVGKATARRLWPDLGSVVGQRLRFEGEGMAGVEVVGVVGDIKYRAITDDLASAANDPEVYLSLAQSSSTVLEFVVRSRDLSPVPATRLREAVHGVDRELAVNLVASMQSAVETQTAMSRLQSTLLGAFGLVGLALGAVGLYGLLAYAVARRSREIGIRLALGATPRGIVREIIGQGMWLTGVGLVGGIVLGVWAAGIMKTLLFGVESYDPVTLVSATIVLLATALLASYIPARRASRLDPMRILRAE